MERDFTIEKFSELIVSLIYNKYNFVTVRDYIENINNKPNIIILRHDIDLNPENALITATIENEYNIKGSYYFRMTPNSWNESIVKDISEMGHEIGYHYETMDTSNGNIDNAWDQFKFNLHTMRQLIDINTICMHGSPRSKFDNKDIWKKYNYRSLGIIGEPYYDIDFDKVFYLTDTGRKWDGWKVSIRDKVSQQDEWQRKDLVYRTTSQIIKALNEKKFPNKAMFTIHPQRWHDKFHLWSKELLLQNSKNIIKRLMI